MKVEAGEQVVVELGGEAAAAPLAARPARAADEPRVWIVVVANGGQVFWARDNLVAKGFEVYAPVYLHTFHLGAKAGKTEMRPFLDRYFFVRVSRDVDAWRGIFSVKGVGGVLGVRNGRGFGVKDRFVEQVRAHEEAGFIKFGLLESRARPTFQKGQPVKYGVLDALFDEADGRRRGWIIVSMFGKDHRELVDLRDLRESE